MPTLTPRLIACALGLTVAAGCATPAPPSPEPARTASPAKPVATEPPLPRVALDADTLYQILVGEIAGERGQIGLAANMLGDVAQRTRDPRLAERATLAALYSRRYDRALPLARLWVALRPQDMDAREALASVLLELNRTPEAKDQLQVVLTLAARSGNLEQGYLRAAAVLGHSGQHAAALTVMKSLVAQHPRAPVGYFALAQLAARFGDLDQAGVAADEALALQPDSEDAALLKARILVAQKHTRRAQRFFESFLGKHPGAVNVRLNYARYLIDLKKWNQARKQFETVVRSNPNDPDAVYAVGLLSLQTDRMDEAERYLKRALKLRPGNDQAQLYLGQVEESEHHYRQAAHWYGAVAPDSEHYFESQMRLGVVMAERGDLAGAQRHLEGIVPLNDAQRVQLALSEAQVLRDAHQYAPAVAVLDKALAAVPGNQDLLYSRALLAEKLHHLDWSERDLRAILKQDPKNANALNALGYLLTEHTKRYQEADVLLQEALAQRPDDAYILDSMGWLQYRLGHYPEAIRYLRRALRRLNDAEIAAHLGEVLWVTGQHQEAEAVWNRALHTSPNSQALTSVIKKYKP